MDGSDHEIMAWLDKKEEGLAVFVLFGSECFLTKEEIEEVALGLELSYVNFLSVLRFPVGEKTKIDDVLPKGFLERITERGKVWNAWAPQVKILAHSSIEGFMSHWSSVLESLGLGVLIIAMPMHLDQPYNARLVEELEVGTIEVLMDGIGSVMKGGEIVKTIRKVFVEKDSEIVIVKARKLVDMMRVKEEEMIDLVVKEFTTL